MGIFDDVNDYFGSNESKKDKRRKLKRSEEKYIVERQKNLCDICGEPLTPNITEFDHKRPHADGGATTVRNMHAVCRNCHGIKTNVDAVKKIKKSQSQKSDPIADALGMGGPKKKKRSSFDPMADLPDMSLPDMSPKKKKRSSFDPMADLLEYKPPKGGFGFL